MNKVLKELARRRELAAKAKTKDILNLPIPAEFIADSGTHRARELETLVSIVTLLEAQADWDLSPERCCWPKNEYMKRAREQLAIVERLMLGEEK